MTHTYATVIVSDATFDEIYVALAAAHYQHCLNKSGLIDMNGLALVKKTKSPMKVSRTITVTKEIHQCKFSCPYYGSDGHEMRCEHPLAPDGGNIITSPECETGFPKLCPEARGAKAS